ncbi:MAG: Gfo/Idh/MocA family oxidoreductase [Verrucomicrobia bacterium]|nr:Gfo/Idh/MocA family oxidoreductase [Verrucomicrobiota bacterium]
MKRAQPQIGVGLLGYAFMGKAHSIGYRDVPVIAPPGVPWPRLISIFGRTESPLEEARSRFGWEKAVSDWRRLIDDEDVQLIDNAAPNQLHAEPTIAAAKAGKHVYCEKPLGTTIDDAFQMWSAAEYAGVRHMCAFNYRFIPALQLAREIIGSGEIGQIYHYRSNFLLSSALDGTRTKKWRDSGTSGGGALGDLGAHHIDLSRFLIGSEPRRVQAVMRIVIPESETGETIETDDLFAAILEYENGCVGVLEASRVAGGHLVTSRIEIDGSKGSIQFSLHNLNELRIAGCDHAFKSVPVLRNGDPGQANWFPPGHPLGWVDTFSHEAVHLLGAIAGLHEVDPIGATFRDGYYCAEIVAAIERAAKTGAAAEVRYRNLTSRVSSAN